MFKDAAKGLCKQQSQDSASENVTVNTTAKLEQVCSFLKCLLVLRSGNCKLNEANDHSNFFSPYRAVIIIYALEPCLLDHSLQSVWPWKEFPLCKLNSCFLPVTGGRSGAVAAGGLRAPQTLSMVHNRGERTVSTARSVLLSTASDYKGKKHSLGDCKIKKNVECLRNA